MQYTSPPNQQTYYEQVWILVRQIPHSKVATYGQIAQMIPPPVEVDLQEYKAFGPRWVGDAMAACPDDLPWQRVINAQGKMVYGPLRDQRKTWCSATTTPVGGRADHVCERQG